MSEETDKRDKQNSEIDLIDLFNRIARTIGIWLRFAGRAILIGMFFLLRKWLPLSLSIIAGLAVSYGLKKASNSLFSSDLVFRNNLVQIDNLTNRDITGTTADIIHRFNRLHTFCEEGNITALTGALGESEAVIRNIVDISAYWIIDLNKDGTADFVDYKNNHNVYDTTNIRMPDRLNIRVRIKEPQELKNLQTRLFSYISNDSLFQQRNRLRFEQNRELLRRYTYEIEQIDSLQKVKYFEETRRNPDKGSQMIFLQENRTQLFHNDILSLYRSKQGVESELSLHKDVMTVLSEFPYPSRRVNGITFYARKWVPFLFLLTLIVLILFENRKRIADISRKYKV
ncbi:MAG: hypothetical protein MUE32_05525 [Bacteroidales bacterium]|nr:hypothetical protein [Bacteroidales bacterium]